MKTFRIILALVLGGCAVAAAITVFGPLFQTHSQRSDELSTLKADNDRIERRIAELRRKQNEFDSNPEYVELTARKEGRVKAGETVFDFGDPAEGTKPKP